MVKGISPAEPVPDAVRRVVHVRLQPAVEALSSNPEDRDGVVHDIRKRCERTRALLRLVRDDLGKEVYRRENRTLRDAARQFSALRDAAVQIRVHDDVVRAGGVTVTGLRPALVQRHADLLVQVFEREGAARKVGESIATVLSRIDTWPLTVDGWDVLGSGLKRVYRRGRKAMVAAYDEPTAERFHEWRNRVKYLRHQLRLLKELWPDVVGANVRAVHALSDVLGDEHDLAVFGDRAVALADPDDAGVVPLLEFVHCRRLVLQAQARPIGMRLYAEKPSRFVDRLGQYWDAGLAAAVR